MYLVWLYFDNVKLRYCAAFGEAWTSVAHVRVQEGALGKELNP